MTNLRLMVAMAGVALLPGAHAQGNYTPATECVEVMNKARIEAQLQPLTAATQPTLVLPHWRNISDAQFCAALEQGKHPGYQLSEVDASLAIATQKGQTPDCEAAVKEWQGGYSFFGSTLPPEYQSDKAPYNTIQSLSFVALYSPKPSSRVECAYVHCTSASTAGALGGSAGAPAVPAVQSLEQPAVVIPANQTEVAPIPLSPVVVTDPAVVPAAGTRRLGSSGEFYALTCGVVPKVLEPGVAPFSKDEWKNISSVLSSATPLQVPTLFVVLSAVLCSYFL